MVTHTSHQFMHTIDYSTHNSQTWAVKKAAATQNGTKKNFFNYILCSSKNACLLSSTFLTSNFIARNTIFFKQCQTSLDNLLLAYLH